MALGCPKDLVPKSCHFVLVPSNQNNLDIKVLGLSKHVVKRSHFLLLL